MILELRLLIADRLNLVALWLARHGLNERGKRWLERETKR